MTSEEDTENLTTEESQELANLIAARKRYEPIYESYEKFVQETGL